jgi:hypothetical protein
MRFDNVINGINSPGTALEGAKLNDFIAFGVQTKFAYDRDGDN